MSARRSRSDRPVDNASMESHSISPVSILIAAKRPLSKPAMTSDPTSIGDDAPRIVSTGIVCSTSQLWLPSKRANAIKRLSIVCTTTESSLMSGVASISPPALARHCSTPEAASSVMTKPSLVATASTPSPTPGPAEISTSRSAFQRGFPLSGSIATTLPSWLAA